MVEEKFKNTSKYSTRSKKCSGSIMRLKTNKQTNKSTEFVLCYILLGLKNICVHCGHTHRFLEVSIALGFYLNPEFLSNLIVISFSTPHT